ncbi:hypothetical protein AVEN_121627-1 [Araneus ventricosus]|uniref:Uncharacterized protein n=1 Tax=Araneus ventricosus TaxID=182803 RepID=A0A4Y2NQC0_ARAVE|nr:hypothetical protein AVEN_113181-1 [Araneus ventricosus]GBN41112.1 hypothetical protein AVEN_121627-1 [Araneus ventricosus]
MVTESQKGKSPAALDLSLSAPVQRSQSLSRGRRRETSDTCASKVRYSQSHDVDSSDYKLDILEREKEKAVKIYGNQPSGLWWL